MWKSDRSYRPVWEVQLLAEVGADVVRISHHLMQ